MSNRNSLLPKYSTATACAGAVNAAANFGATSFYVFGARDQITEQSKVFPAALAVGGSMFNVLSQVHHTLSVMSSNSANEQQRRD